MKAFKGKTYTAPVEKDRKEQGKFKEKVDHKTLSSRGKIAKKNDKYSSIHSNPTYTKRKRLSVGDYTLLFVIILLFLLFIFLIVSLIFSPTQKQSEPITNKFQNK